MEAQVHQLTLGLRDPLRPTFCTACAFNFFSADLTTDTRPSTVRLLRQKHHAFLTGIMDFVTVERTPRDIVALQTGLRLAVYRCPHKAKVHEPGFILGEDFADRAISLFWTIILFCLWECSRLLSTQRFSRHGLWPETVDDILPRGPRQSLAAMLFWFNRCERDVMANTFEYIFIVCRPELMPQLLVDGPRTFFVDTVCLHLDRAVSEIRAVSPRPAHNSQHMIERMSQLLHTINGGVGSELDSFVRVVHGMEDQVLRSLDGAFQAADSSDARTCLALALNSVHHFAKMQLSTHLEAHLATTAIRRLGAHADLQITLRIIADRVVCCAPGCDTHQHQLGTGKKLLRCASCGVYRYCSRECQRRHWTMQRMPHKEVCRQIGDICSRAPYTLSPDEFTAALACTPWDESECNSLKGYLNIEQAQEQIARYRESDPGIVFVY